MAKRTKIAATLLTTAEIEERCRWHRHTRDFVTSFASVVRPPSRLPLSEWADRYRVLSSESSAEPGQWITAKAPYEKAIMDAISDSFCPKVVVQKGAQLGITDSAILNPVGYFMDVDPCPILVVQPTIELAEAFSTDRLSPMLRDCPRLRGMVADARTRDSHNTLRRKAFRGGYIALGGANSAASLSGRPVRIVLLDEVDRYPTSAGTEGNPIQLAVARTSAFWNRKAVLISSPGIKGVSHIEREMMLSTQEHWYLPCPVCDTMQILMWERVRLEDFTHRCERCDAYEPKYKWLLGHGEWRAHRPNNEKGEREMTRGFFLSGMYNPWIEWDILAAEWVRAQAANEEGDIEPLKAFNNTRLGLLHEDIGDRVEADLYTLRREVYEAEVPDGVLVLTAGVDVGERQLNYEVVGWGKGRQSWGIEYGILDGDWREDDVWKLLDQAVFDRAFVTTDGKQMRVRKMAVDSGYAAEFVYRYTKPRQPRAISTKGEGGIGKPLIKGAGTLTKSNAARLITLGVDTGKEEIVNRLRVARVGPGYCHFPKLENDEPARGYDEEYFRGLTAERRVVKAKHGFKTYMWVKRLSQRNEPFDCRNYAMACLAMRWAGIDLEKMGRDVYEPPRKVSGQFGAQKATMIDEGPRESGGSKFGAANRPVE